ncbi:MAG: ATP-binding cassette domain-containing protein [Chloroflexota bacterium]|nr:ATP-binding cassette domain-containing protein [Chloroflexota bacterium]MDQ6908256.1 ATP-binding cassette domain-containing protein [Chloroflexota bacterium]
MSLDVREISKAFGAFAAVQDVSFTAEQGQIFGFLGTNGAGKTTTMRIILDILRPDSGSVTWNGRPNTDVPRRLWGYLPEERGLYPKMVVEDQLLFLAQLYGASARDARRDLDAWLERFDIVENRRKRVEQLSKGNQQKIQFLAAVLHDPEILVMDEPFSGLDPVNAAQMIEAFGEMRRRGKTIIFSTHQMEQAEELCQAIAIIHRGRLVVQGDVRAVKRSTGRQVVRLALADDPDIPWLDRLPGVTVTKRRPDFVEMDVQHGSDPETVLRAALEHGGRVTRFEIGEPSLNDIFLASVGGQSATDSDEMAAPRETVAVS